MGRLSKQIQSDLDSHLQQSYNRLIAKIMRRLATKKRSPVWTGFFASSWQAGSSPIQAVDPLESPWKELAEIKANAAWDKETVPKEYIIKPRFYPPRQFSYKRRTYIGNSAEYAIYALEKGNIQAFAQGGDGELAQLVREAFQERKPLISVAYDVKEGGFGSTAGQTYIAYEEV